MTLPAAPPSVNYLVIGHLARDRLPAGGARLGGTAAYASLTARALGWSPAVVTSFADDLDIAPLAGIPLQRRPAEASTEFRHLETDNGREQHLLSRAANLTVEAVPEAWRAATILHLAPVAAEVAGSLTGHFPASDLVGVTLQGWLRRPEADGRVAFQPLADSTPLQHAGAVVASLEDFAGDESEIEALAALGRLLVITEGARGARVYWNGDVRRFPAPPAAAVDPTGAGDIFAAAFFIRYQQTRDPWEAARFANLLAAASVERHGLSGVPTARQAEQAAVVLIR